MATDIRIRLDDLLRKVADAYVDDQQKKGIRSSGASAQSITRTINDIAGKISGEVTGVHYFYQQRHGRRPGKFPPIDSILNWIKTKGITPRDRKTSERSLAFLFARKIARSGTDIFENKRPALDVQDLIDRYLEEFKAQVRKDRAQQAKEFFKP